MAYRQGRPKSTLSGFYNLNVKYVKIVCYPENFSNKIIRLHQRSIEEFDYDEQGYNDYNNERIHLFNKSLSDYYDQSEDIIKKDIFDYILKIILDESQPRFFVSCRYAIDKNNKQCVKIIIRCDYHTKLKNILKFLRLDYSYSNEEISHFVEILQKYKFRNALLNLGDKEDIFTSDYEELCKYFEDNP